MASMKNRPSHEVTLELQKLLRAEGCNIGHSKRHPDGVDGILGPKTRRALHSLSAQEQQSLMHKAKALAAAKTAHPSASLPTKPSPLPRSLKHASTAKPSLGDYLTNPALLKPVEATPRRGSLREMLSPIAGTIAKRFTEKNKGVDYEWGSKNLKRGGIDCSGWAYKATLHTMAEINEKAGRDVYNIASVEKTLRSGAAWQFEAVRQKTRHSFSPDDIKKGNLPAGALIVVSPRNTPDFAQGRPHGISHIAAVVVDEKGNKFISESAPTKGGVALTAYTPWVRKHLGKGAELRATDPFALTTTKDPNIVSQIAEIKHKRFEGDRIQMQKALLSTQMPNVPGFAPGSV